VLQNINFPIDDENELQRLSDEFNQFTNNHFPGTVAAGDGIVFMMDRPTKKEVDGDVISFFTRKGYYAFGLQAFCDARCRFLSISSRLCSSSHDS
jgi:hypothetical protein